MADLINDGDTVMFGAGHMPGVMGNYLAHKQDLGCHTEVVVPLPLVRGGVINGSRRNFNRGKINLTGVAAIGEEDEAFLDGNPMFDLRDMGVNNDPKFIAQNDNFVAINSCLEITMWGEMGVERIGNRYFRGIGGQVEFILGALMVTTAAPSTLCYRGDWAATGTGTRRSCRNSPSRVQLRCRVT